MDKELIKKTILNLEKQLLLPETRNSGEKIAEILDSDFTEFCSSGTIYHYKHGDTFPAPDLNCEITDFSIKILADDIVLATYKTIKYNETNIKYKYSLRSSIWKYTDNKWNIIFHQGTLSKKF